MPLGNSQREESQRRQATQAGYKLVQISNHLCTNICTKQSPAKDQRTELRCEQLSKTKNLQCKSNQVHCLKSHHSLEEYNNPKYSHNISNVHNTIKKKKITQLIRKLWPNLKKIDNQSTQKQR